MKKLILLLSVYVFLSFHLLSQTCLCEGITFTSQSQIDNFQDTYPGCKNIAGDVIICGYGINHLNGLYNLISIEGDLFIGTWEYGGNPGLLNLAGLNNINHVGGDMTIIFNSRLSDLAGLDGLTSIGGCLLVGWNSIDHLNGLDHLTCLGGNLEIQNNSKLLSLHGLESICSVGGSLNIDHNEVLYTLDGLDHLNSISGDLYVGNSPHLIDMGGLKNLSAVSGDLSLGYNDELVSLNGLEGLTSIKSIYLIGNNKLKNLNGLNNITSTTGSLWVGGINLLSGNRSLISLDGLNNLTTIGGSLNINYNDNLTSLSGLEYLNSIGKDLILRHNKKLTELSGLKNLNAETIQAIDISHNHSLSDCSIEIICHLLSQPDINLTIQDNGSGCNCRDEIKSSCSLGTTGEIRPDEPLIIYPNPSSHEITITFHMYQSARATIEIFNIMGKAEMTIPVCELNHGEQNLKVNITDLQDGIYLCRLSVENKVVVKKIVKR